MFAIFMPIASRAVQPSVTVWRRNVVAWINTPDRVAALIAWLPIVRVDELVKDLRPPEAAALRAVLDKFINTNRNAVQAIKAAF
jgi:hypothetical protein